MTTPKMRRDELRKWGLLMYISAECAKDRVKASLYNTAVKPTFINCKVCLAPPKDRKVELQFIIRYGKDEHAKQRFARYIKTWAPNTKLRIKLPYYGTRIHRSGMTTSITEIEI